MPPVGVAPLRDRSIVEPIPRFQPVAVRQSPADMAPPKPSPPLRRCSTMLHEDEIDELFGVSRSPQTASTTDAKPRLWRRKAWVPRLFTRIWGALHAQQRPQ